ncbi:MAG: FAD-dependent oxidoreductase [Candidatus Dormiibacterota bacterium]
MAIKADPSAFPVLQPSELAIFEAVGTRRRVAAGEYLYHEGDPGYDFWIVLSGAVDVIVDDADDRVITTHRAGQFLGELNLLTGVRAFVSARVAEPGEVLGVPADLLRRVIATEPELGDKILAAFMARRAALLAGDAVFIRVVGSRFSPETMRIREFLSRTRLPHEWLDPDADAEVDDIVRAFSLEPSDLPVVIATGQVLRRPTPGELASYLGLTLENLPERSFDLVIVGGGPAGLAAAVYGASEGLSTLGVDMTAPGGQAGTSSRIENYFGFTTGIAGAELTQRGLVQAEKFGARLSAPCTAVALGEEAGHLTLELSDGTVVAARAVIAATGARYRRLPVDHLREFETNGVYYAATELEARQCAGSPVMVVGGGNSAGQAAVFLADKGSAVTLVIRAADLSARMSRYLVDRLVCHSRIEVMTSTAVVGLEGDGALHAVHVDGRDGKIRVPAAALFSFIGADPESSWLCGCAALDSGGFVLTDRALTDEHLGERWSALGRRPLPFETSRPGLFAVGDVRSGSTKRVAAAVGEGSAAVSAVHEFLAFDHR